MRPLALVVAGLIAAIGVAAAVSPDVVIGTGRHLVSPSGLYAAAAFRIGVGLVLILAGLDSLTPGTLRAIGAVALVSGVATPLVGVEAARARLEWEAAHVTFFRFEGAAFVFLGVVIASALRPGRSPSSSTPRSPEHSVRHS